MLVGALGLGGGRNLAVVNPQYVLLGLLGGWHRAGLRTATAGEAQKAAAEDERQRVPTSGKRVVHRASFGSRGRSV